MDPDKPVQLVNALVKFASADDVAADDVADAWI